ncbi:MAG: UvrD-helicase domain-containing protein [Betaproteobacteria bacterium]|nr:UvrD-helicase domain-containing protein [Betaproteobacteria bacterium]
MSLPLTGAHLIEASAGTGKTWTLAVLVARLLLEAGRPCREILLVTFTRAATAEIKSRVVGLLQSLDAMGRTGPDAARSADAAVDAVLASVARARIDPAVLHRRLRDALLQIDDVVITTLHGFYQRTLADHALAAGDLMDAQLTTDIDAPLMEIAHEFWQRTFASPDTLAGLPPDARPAMLVRLLHDRVLASAEALTRWAEPLLSRQGMVPQGPDAARSSEALLAQASTALQPAFEACRQAFDEAALRDILVAHPSLKRNSYRPDSQPARVREVAGWLHGDDTFEVELDTLKWFTPSKIATGTKVGCVPPSHAFFEAAQHYLDARTALDDAGQGWCALRRREAFDFISRELPLRLAHAGLRSTDRIVGQLAALLDSPAGPRLVEALRARHTAVLVDEFQDTDLVQWSLLQRVFVQHADGLFVVVGDPKQAIYSFRGADIRAYLAARAALLSHHALRENHRSQPPLVDVLNQLFGALHDPAAFGAPDITYLPMDAANPQGEKTLTGAYSSPFEVIEVGGTAMQVLADAAARRVASLLSGGTQIDQRALRPGDIAVLVRSNSQARAIKQALQRLRVPASLRARESVFASFEAELLAVLLAALADPDDHAAVATLCFSPLVGDDVATLAARRDDALARLGARARVAAWAQRAARDGFMAAAQRLAFDCDTYGRWAVLPDGERRITNWRHLLELTEAAAQQGRPMLDELRAWLDDERHAASKGEAALLRLDSEGDTVSVLTVHRSKGLQFPVVVLPFLDSTSKPKDRSELLRPAAHGTVLDFGPPPFDAQALAQAQLDEAGEDMRLTYVALTRAQRQCVVLWPVAGKKAGKAKADDAADDSARGPLARLLGGRTWAELAQATNGAVQVRADAPDAAPRPWQPPQPLALPPLRTPRPVARGWRLSSYSSLLAQADVQRAAVERPDHDRQLPPSGADAIGAGDDARFTFPAGAHAGECLHALFERLDAAQPAGWPLTVAQALQEFGLPPSLADATLVWLGAMTQATLRDAQGNALTLGQALQQPARREWEFHLPTPAWDAASLHHALQAAGVSGLGAAGPGLPAGFLKGFVDLVFEHAGRYFVVDYKSNWLGARLGDYDDHAVAQAMHEHHYTLQAALYQVALHRHLRAVHGGYAPQRHLGGVFYLFLRGMQPGDTRAVWHRQFTPAQLNAIDALFAPATGVQARSDQEVRHEH